MFFSHRAKYAVFLLFFLFVFQAHTKIVVSFLPTISISYRNRVTLSQNEQHLFLITLRWDLDDIWIRNPGQSILQLWELKRKKNLQKIKDELSNLQEQKLVAANLAHKITLLAKEEMINFIFLNHFSVEAKNYYLYQKEDGVKM